VEQRSLGRGGPRVSALGYGAWGIGQHMWVGAEDDESLRALRRAFDEGVTFVDTALGYGDGHSEQLVGRAVRDAPQEIAIATKIPPKDSSWPALPGSDPEEAFPADWIVECTERSLRHLGVETIDVQQFHVWSDEWIGRGSWLEGAERLKADGKIRLFGVSVNDHEPANVLRLIETGVVDTVQVIFNIFEQRPEDELFPAAARAGVGVIVRVPFDEGALTGRVGPETEFPEGDWRRGYFAGDRRQQVWERVNAIADELGAPIDDLPEIALRFCLSFDAVSTVIAGMRRAEHVDANVPPRFSDRCRTRRSNDSARTGGCATSTAEEHAPRS